MTLYVNMDDKPVKDQYFPASRHSNCMKVNPLERNLDTNSA
jgi:hypothetical protein